MSDVFEVMKRRRSVRKFAPKKIEHEKILQILEAARIAPSSSNRQAWHFVVIDDKSLIELIPKQVALGEKIVIKWLKDAPLVIAGCYTKALTHHIARLFDHENHLVDVSIAMTHIALAATALEIGTCFVGWFNHKKLKKLLNIPKQYNIAVLLALGYPIEKSSEKAIGNIEARPRKALEEIISYNRFGEGFQ
jgi:nitroreductase